MKAIEGMAAHILGELQAGPATMEKYAREELPLGAERSLGFATWSMVRAATMLQAGHSQVAHFSLPVHCGRGAVQVG